MYQDTCTFSTWTDNDTHVSRRRPFARDVNRSFTPRVRGTPVLANVYRDHNSPYSTFDGLSFEACLLSALSQS